MKAFREQNHVAVALAAVAMLLLVVAAALNFSKLPFSAPRTSYHADLADASGLTKGDPVTVAGVRVGTITGLRLRGDHVQLDMQVRSSQALGRLTTLNVKVLSLLGQEYVQLDPLGPPRLQPGATIAQSRTFGTHTLVDTLTNLGVETGQIDSQALAQALHVVDQSVTASTPAQTAAVIDGVGRLSQIIADRQDQLAQLVTEAKQVAATLSTHSGQLVTLVGQSNLVLQVLQQRQADIHQLLSAVQDLAGRVGAIVTSKQSDLSQLLANLDGVSANLAKESGAITSAIPLVAGFATYGANAAGSGPYADIHVLTTLFSDGAIAECAKNGGPAPATGCNVP
ncbi:MCE family protein [Acidiferrimicrobium sp. IK]|uniref:MCE family protein n=1 Tax=Acidiferrimicrobium sp. IK TaxID=2871700 RepID=UPI0021CB3574|nr:MCE family protein [Acidiferrimicrobium sp. IK]MCU4187493.1 MCE family protein [Acidiferrimicrobium sp. IK]